MYPHIRVVFIFINSYIHSFHFLDHGKTWLTKFKNFCAGKKQSPINIKNPQCDKALNDSITFINYGNAGPTKFPLENNGRWLIVRAASTTAKIKLGGPATYRFHQLHFHWGKDDTRGSEHQLDGKVFPAAVRHNILLCSIPKF
jgi:carbonic anhydrase